MTTRTVRLSPPPAARAERPRQPRRAKGSGGRIGILLPVRVSQVALWELAVVAVAATVLPWRPVSVVVAGVAVVVIVLTSVRWSGLCAYEWAAVHWRFRRRPSSRRGADPISAVLPDLRLRRQIDRAGNRAGLAESGDSLSAVVRLVPTANPDPEALLRVLESAFGRTDIRLAGAQLVVWSVPSPPRARYYGDRRDFEPVQVHWLALRYRTAESPAAAVARGGGATGAARATATAALSLAGKLAEAGYSGVVLDEPELRQELLVALGSDHAALGGKVETTVQETWQDWSIGTLRQFTYQPRRAADGRAVLGRYVPQAAFTCASYSLRRAAHGRLRGDSVVRIGVHPASKLPKPKDVSRMLGMELLPRNGRHGESVLDNLPLAR